MELTLTGASLTSSSQSPPTSHTHDHTHTHNHTHANNNNNNNNNNPPPPTNCCPHLVQHSQKSLSSILQNEEALNAALLTSVKIGTFEAFVTLCKAVLRHPSLGYEELSKYRKDGHTLVHWAAKRESPQFLSYLATIPSLDLNLPSLDNVGMTPLHWSATTGSIPTTHTLLKHLPPSSLHTRDNSGCTPLLISAQYGHANLCAYLLKIGSDPKSVDKNGDNLLHWASYKGCTEVVGLACFLFEEMEFLQQVDAFGQTALHLASLRGNMETVLYLLEEAEMRWDKVKTKEKQQRGTRAERGRRMAATVRRSYASRKENDPVRYLLALKDKDGKTALDLAVKKKKTTVELILRDWEDRLLIRDHPSCFRHVKTIIKQICSIQNWKLWMGFNVANNTNEVSFLQQKNKWPMALVITVIFITLALYPWKFLPLKGEGVLWDCPFLHMFTLSNILILLLTYILTYTTNPGILSTSSSIPHLRNLTHHLQSLYESTLESYTTPSSPPQITPLCHSCHISKPKRSKHCRIQRRCVLLFDHYCPFVGTTVGLYNYPHFYAFLASMTCAEIGFWITWILFLQRSPTLEKEVLCLGVLVGMFVVPAGGMLMYHTQLILKNLTTNEHQNLWRYEYLRDGDTGGYRNEFDEGGMVNVFQRLCPKDDGMEERLGEGRQGEEEEGMEMERRELIVDRV